MQRTVDIVAMTGDPVRPGSDPSSPENQSRRDPMIKMDPAKPPTIDIGYREFPRMVYKHPKQKFSKRRRRNDLGEIEVYQVANEAEAKLVHNKEDFDAALKSGWKKEHYVLPEVPEFMEEEEAVK